MQIRERSLAEAAYRDVYRETVDLHARAPNRVADSARDIVGSESRTDTSDSRVYEANSRTRAIRSPIVVLASATIPRLIRCAPR